MQSVRKYVILYLRHKLIIRTSISVYFYFGKNACSVSHTLLVLKQTLCRNLGAMHFSCVALKLRTFLLCADVFAITSQKAKSTPIGVLFVCKMIILSLLLSLQAGLRFPWAVCRRTVQNILSGL